MSSASEAAGLDAPSLDRVHRLLREHGVLSASETLVPSLVSGGRSNLTYRLQSERSDLVLRRPPLGHLLSTAHDMSREFRVTAALHDANTGVPVPRPLLLWEDPTVIGSPFYVMKYVEGRVLRTATDALELPAQSQTDAADHLIQVLARLHGAEIDTLGLENFGRPERFMARQVSRWTRQLESSRSREIPGIEDLAEALGASIPAQSYATLIHGDYRLDNCIVDDSRIVAVLDWEMATLGDPLADLGLFAVYYAGLVDIENTVVHSLAGLGAFPPLTHLLERYSTMTGHDLAALDWYIAFAWFKFAVILEGIHYRTTLGASLGTGFAGVADLVQPSVDRGLAALAGDTL